MSDINTTKTFWDLDQNDVFDICVVKIKHINWKPEVEDISWHFNQNLGLVKCLLQSVTSMNPPYNRIKFVDGHVDISSSNSGVAKGYAWAMLNTNKCGYFAEYRVYFADNSSHKIRFCNKLDTVDELVSKLI